MYPLSIMLISLSHILLKWRIWCAPNNATRWQIGFNSAFKGLKRIREAVHLARMVEIYKCVEDFVMEHVKGRDLLSEVIVKLR